MYTCAHTQTHTPLHRETLFSHDKEGHPAICNDIYGPWKHYAKCHKSDRNRQTLYGVTCMWNLKKSKL